MISEVKLGAVIHDLYPGCEHLLPAPQGTLPLCNVHCQLHSAMGFSTAKNKGKQKLTNYLV